MYYGWLNKPIIVFGNSAMNSENKIEKSIFVQAPYLRSNYIKAKIGENFDMKNPF